MRVLVDTLDETASEEVRAFSEQLRQSQARRFALTAAAGDGRLELLHGSDVPSSGLKAAAGKAGDAAPDYPLERWLVQAYAYSEEQAARIGIFGRLFSGNVERVKAGVIHDAKRFSIQSHPSLGDVEIGVAVRLSVATSKVKGNLELTLPNLAAEAQLGSADTRIGISVIGYRGPLGNRLPAPKKLDIETYVEYVEAFRDIQALIFSEEGWPYVCPTLLSYDLETPGRPPGDGKR